MATREVKIEELRPGDTTINFAVRKVLVFAQPGVRTKFTFTPGTERYVTVKQGNDFMADELHGMADLLSGSPRFELMETLQSPVSPDDDTYNWAEIDTICRSAGVDACLVLCRQDADITLGKYLEYDNFGEEYYATGKILVTGTWKLYDLVDRLIIGKKVIAGTNFYGSLVYDPNQAIFNLPDFNRMTTDYATVAGEQFAKWIAPYWEESDRYYYTSGNKEMTNALPLADSGKWNEILDVWRKYALNDHTVVAKHAAYNCILAYEMVGKLDSALYMANQTYQRFKLEEANDYATHLEDRIREKNVVAQQLGIKDSLP